MYDFELERVTEIIKREGYSVVGLQFPDGLRDHATKIADEVSANTNCVPLISADPCYGACDLADAKMKEAGAKALFHYGHSEIPIETAIPVHHIECRSDADPLPLISSHLEIFPKRIGLVATIQHVQTLSSIKDYLKKEGFEPHIGPAKGRAKYPGQVLGCSFSSATSISDLVDGFLFIGSGNFHPLGVSISTGKKTLAIDFVSGEVRDVTEIKDKLLKKRYAKLSKAMGAKTFGIVVGEKKGQMRKALAKRVRKKLEENGKQSSSIHLEEITPENLMSFRNLDVLINTACPRIALEDALRFRQPMLTPLELEMVLGEREWDDYEIDEFSI